jgi:predicted DNA-binding protein (UPF0251 family)
MNNVNYGYNEAYPTAPINKVGRKGQPTRKAIEKTEAIQLLKTGLTQKEVSERVGVTEKTLGKWAKECHNAQKIEADTLTNLKNRLLAITSDNTTPIVDIKNLVSIIKRLETN